jgi:putative transposase
MTKKPRRLFTDEQKAEAARTVIAEWIEVFYNRQRIHSTIGYLSPVQFEENYWFTLDPPMAA